MKNLNKIIAVFLIFGLIGLNSCKKEEIIKIVGFLQGHVFDGNTDEPLDGVKVEWDAAGKKDSVTATATDGYLISNLIEGQYTIWFSKANYTTITYNASIRSGENFDNGTIRGGANREVVITYNPNMYPLDGSLTGRIYKNENGKNIPAEGVTVQLDYNFIYKRDDNGYRFVPGLYTATTDADGYYTFSNIPSTQTVIRFLDFTDANGESYYDAASHGTSSRTIYLSSGTSYAYGNVNLTRVGDRISLTGSNLYSSPNVGTQDFDVTSNITLTFNKIVDMTNTENLGDVRLEVSGVEVEADITYADNVITINPTQDLAANTTYRVNYDVYGAQTYDNTSGSIVFTTSDDATVPVQVTGFAIDYDLMGANWLADFYDGRSGDGIRFTYNRISNATRYEVYAKDDYNNPEYILVDTYTPADYVQGMVDHYVTLPSQFDYYDDDAVRTPLSHGTTVTYKVRAINSAGAGPFSTEIPIMDETGFDAGDLDISNSQNTTADNSLKATPRTITKTFSLFSGRYADVNVTPNVTIWNGVSESTPTQTVTWIDHQHGTIEFEVPAGDSYVGYDLRLHGITDSSGNTMAADDYESEGLY